MKTFIGKIILCIRKIHGPCFIYLQTILVLLKVMMPNTLVH